ncbi:MAG: DUF4197 family protein, partial [Mariprofundaceae bacterium]|nr:DUF4197 family protein [Mariprofundaceae bacterium]
MKRFGLLVCLVAGQGYMPAPAMAGLVDDIVSSLERIGDHTGKHASPYSLSERDIAEALRQALRKGTRISVDYLGRSDGFWKRSQWRIPLPDSLRAPARLLRQAGLGSYADELHRRINRAAEKAVPLAKPIFYDAIRTMSFADVKRIWKGPDDATTRYFERKTTTRLVKAFSPVVHRELECSGVVRSYRAFSSQYASLP